MRETEPLSQISFAAFIMTYERPQIVLDTIKRLQEQTFPPHQILVVDNSESSETEAAVNKLRKSKVEYYRVGYNSGPAGAAKIGLQKLSGQGFNWIYWGDDDNPPMDKNIFQDLFQKLIITEGQEKIGIMGGKGGRLNPWSGRIKTFSNSDLLKNDILEVDMVPGGGTLLVNADVVKKDVLPEPKLFFGFEELDFGLKAQKAGFRVVVDTKIWLKDNYNLGYRDKKYKWKDSFFGKEDFLWRSYYSTRNLLYILSRNGYYSAFLFLFLKTILKSVAGFRYGFKYGSRNFRIQWRAIKHFLTGVFGKG